MTINLLCPHCNGVLTDKFSAEKCYVPIGTALLEMECLKCGLDVDIEVAVMEKEALDLSLTLTT